MRRTIAIAASLLLANCNGQVITKSMNALSGQPISAVTARIGMPSAEQTIMGQKVYVWFSRNVYEGTETKCQIRVFVGPGDIITGWDSTGNDNVCGSYAQLLIN